MKRRRPNQPAPGAFLVALDARRRARPVRWRLGSRKDSQLQCEPHNPATLANEPRAPRNGRQGHAHPVGGRRDDQSRRRRARRVAEVEVVWAAWEPLESTMWGSLGRNSGRSTHAGAGTHEAGLKPSVPGSLTGLGYLRSWRSADETENRNSSTVKAAKGGGREVRTSRRPLDSRCP